MTTSKNDLTSPDASMVGSGGDLNIKQATKELSEIAGFSKHTKIKIIDGLSSFEALERSRESDIETFFISKDTSLTGKPQAITSGKIRLNLAHKIKKEEVIDYKFLHESVDGRELKVNCKKSLTEEFYLYKLFSNDREFILLSQEKLSLVEQNFKGMALHSASATEVTKRFALRGYVNIYFVAEAIPNVKILSSKEILEATKNISKQQFLDYLFYHNEDKKVYQQPQDYKLLVATTLLSSKYEGYPLHLITMGSAGTGKTKKQESLNSKFTEQAGIFEASSSRIKGLIPSFKEKPASLGYLLSCNRIALVDELFKMLESALNDGHSSSNQVNNFLQQINPILEHKVRTVSSGNDNSFIMCPTSKLIADCNPLAGKYSLPEHLNIIDKTTLSRALFWVIDGVHSEFITQEKQKIDGNNIYSGTSEHTLNNNLFLSIYDTLNIQLSKIETKKANEIYLGISATLHDNRLKPLWSARGFHHTMLIIDGITKINCLFDKKTTDFIAQQEDYDNAQALLIRLLQTMQSPVGGNYV